MNAFPCFALLVGDLFECKSIIRTGYQWNKEWISIPTSSRNDPSQASSSAISDELSQSSQAAVKRKPRHRRGMA